MINEFVYCPRLFYLEWVQGRFADNDDTRLGRQTHRRVDTETGSVPLPAGGELRTARSVTLSSQRLGVIAKVDVLEGVDGAVVPVEYKKGEPQADGTAWPSDEAQVCIQGIVLRASGYRCERAEIYYAKTKQRISVELTSELLAKVASIVAAARIIPGRRVQNRGALIPVFLAGHH